MALTVSVREIVEGSRSGSDREQRAAGHMASSA